MCTHTHWNVTQPSKSSNIDGPREYHTKSDRERQIPYISYMWNLKKIHKYIYYKTETDLRTRKTNLWLTKGKG